MKIECQQETNITLGLDARLFVLEMIDPSTDLSLSFSLQFGIIHALNSIEMCQIHSHFERIERGIPSLRTTGEDGVNGS